MSDDQELRHVRHEVLTREHYKLTGVDAPLPSGAGVAWCKAVCSNEWFFGDASHVLHSIEQESSISPCPACLRAMRSVLDLYLDGLL